jgi:transaldolase
MDQPVMERLFNPVPQYVIDELCEKLPDFKRGYEEGGISAEEYEKFGPVVKFWNSFVKDWKRVLGEAKQRLG